MDSMLNYLSFIPFDWIIIILLALALTIDSLRSGSSRAIAISLAAPVTLLIYGAFFDAKFLTSISAKIASPISQSVLFIIMLAAMFFIVRRIIDQYGNSGGTVVQSAVCGISCSIILLVIWFEIPALESIWKFGPQVTAVFGEAYKFWWIIGAYSALAFARS